jgi:hypothetical protein
MVSSRMAWAWASRAVFGAGLSLASLVADGVSSFAIAPMPHGAVLIMKVVANR